MTTFTATYSPDDNKLRLSASSRLDPDTYARFKAAGFAWAPKQEQFIAPMWTPSRADLCIELAGEIEDDDGSLIDRAEDRAERFEDYSDKRAAESERAADYVHRIADGIPLGQPILVGHHSERHARKDAERIQNGMRKAVQLFDTAEYWKRRAASAIAHAKYKERPDVRHRRIKGIEADARKQAKELDECETLIRLWLKVPRVEWDKQTGIATIIAGRTPSVSTPATEGQPYGSSLYSELDAGRMHGDTAWRRAVAQFEGRIAWARRWADHYANRLTYERAMLDESGGIVAERFDIQPGGRVLVRGEWLVVLRLNKSGGQVVSVTTNAQFVRVKGIEEIKDYRAPAPDDAEKVAAVSKLAPMCNYPGEGFHPMKRAEWDDVHKDYRGSRDLGQGAKPNRWGSAPDAEQIAAAAAGQAPHRVRSMIRGGRTVYVYLTDAKRTDPPMVGDRPRGAVRGPWSAPKDADPAPVADPVTFERQREPAALPPVPTHSAPPAGDSQASKVDAMRASLKAGVQVVSAPQLFPTPPELAARMVEEAQIFDGARVLEPSAGTGRIVDAVRDHARTLPGGVSIVAVEVSHPLAQGLRAKYESAPEPGELIEVHCRDFIAEPLQIGRFDAVLMNPPFANGADVDHVTHAAGFLKPGGRLVAIMSAGVTFREDRKTRAFRRMIENGGGTIDPLPAGTFESSGTGVNVVMVTFDAPAADDGPRRVPTEAEQIAQAEAFGRAAFARGIGPASAQDPDFLPMLRGRMPGETPAGCAPTLDMLDAWARGWHAANLAAPIVDEVPPVNVPDPAPEAIATLQDQARVIAGNVLRKRWEWAEDGMPTAQAIEKAAAGLESCAAELDKEKIADALATAYRAAAVLVRQAAAEARANEEAQALGHADAADGREQAAWLGRNGTDEGKAWAAGLREQPGLFA